MSAVRFHPVLPTPWHHGESAAIDMADRQICFRLPGALPAASPLRRLRLRDAQAEALSELLQVFACGEESASLAFARAARSPIENAARRELTQIAEEEVIHERLLRGLRRALPAPVWNVDLRRSVMLFFSRNRAARNRTTTRLDRVARFRGLLDSFGCSRPRSRGRKGADGRDNLQTHSPGRGEARPTLATHGGRTRSQEIHQLGRRTHSARPRRYPRSAWRCPRMPGR